MSRKDSSRQFCLKGFLFVFLSFSTLFTPFTFAQVSVKINGEVELMGRANFDSIQVLIKKGSTVFKKKNVLKSGTFKMNLPLHNIYEMVITRPGYYSETIDINTEIEDSLKKVWPVFIKTRLRPDTLPQIIVNSLISYDPSLNRFAHKNIGDPILIPNNKVTDNQNSSAEEDTLEEMLLTKKELEKIKEIKDREYKSKLEKGLAQGSQVNKERAYIKRKLEVMSRQIEERIAEKRAVDQNLYLNLLKEYEIELETRAINATQKRKLIEEIAETKKERKIKERKFVLDE